MDGPRFDTLARTLAATRRTTRKTLLGAGLGLLLAGRSGDGAAADCKQVGQRCSGDKDCCKHAQCRLSGVCACKSGFTDCNGKCKDLTTNKNHCGACNNDCGDGEFCCSGACIAACAGGETCCNGACCTCPIGNEPCGDTCCPPSRRAAMGCASMRCTPTRTTAGHVETSATNRAAVATAAASPAFSPMRTTAAVVASSACSNSRAAPERVAS